jgi:hypothetical protein
MMLTINRFYALLLIALLSFFGINAMLGKIAFGCGLGDIVYRAALWAIGFLAIFSFVKHWKKQKRLFLSNLILSVATFWIIMSATLWRSVEYSWNGEIFYPSKKALKMTY